MVTIAVLAQAAPIVSATAICLSLLVGTAQVLFSNRRQRQQNAVALFSNLVHASLSHPVLAFPPRFLDRYNFDDNTIDGSKEQFEQYTIYVAMLMMVSRQILDNLHHDPYWRRVVSVRIGSHRAYLLWLSETPQERTDVATRWGPRVAEIVQETIKKG